MKQTLMFIFIGCTLFACKSSGWSKEERDKTINSCITEAKKTPEIADSTVMKYCACYQEKLEKKFPKVKDMEKATENDIFPLAEECLVTTGMLPTN